MKARIVKGWNRARARYETLKKRIKRLREQAKAIKEKLSFLAPLKDVNNLMYFTIGLIVLYGIIAQFLGWF